MDIWNSKTQRDARNTGMRHFAEPVSLTCEEDKEESCNGGKFHGFFHEH
jgi:hypothetical protein